MKKLLALVCISCLLYLSCATNVVGIVHDSSVPLERSAQLTFDGGEIIRYNGVAVDWKKKRGELIQIPAGNTLLEIDLNVNRSHGSVVGYNPYGTPNRVVTTEIYEGKVLFSYNFQPNKHYLLYFLDDFGTTTTVFDLFGNQKTSTTDLNAQGWGFRVYAWEIGEKLSKAAAHYLEFVPFLRPETILK
jgi:hypothetical protein